MTSAFELFELKPSFSLNLQELEDRYYILSRELHPDRVPRGNRELLIKNQSLSAQLNQAYLALKNPDTRLEYLLDITGVKRVEGTDQDQSQIPMELAEEYFDLREAIMDKPEGFFEKKNAFLGHLKNLAQDLEKHIFDLAALIDWSDTKSTETELLEIVNLRKKHSYLQSLAENTEKLGAAQ